MRKKKQNNAASTGATEPTTAPQESMAEGDARNPKTLDRDHGAELSQVQKELLDDVRR
jgi:hypothetical protein